MNTTRTAVISATRPTPPALRFRNLPRWWTRSALAAAGLLTVLAGGAQAQVTAVRANDFLNSIGACTHMTQGIDNPTNVASCLTYAGIRNIRDDGSTSATTRQKFIDVHNASGAKVSLLCINGDVNASIAEWEHLKANGALLACEEPNEPNNWHVTYQGQTSSSTDSLPIARFCKDLYAAVKADPNLAGIPVFASSEAGGSEPNNCGLQFLTIPSGAGTLMPDGTIYADYANPHNYVCAHFSAIVDNNAWQAEDPTLNSSWDGLYVEYGHTWWSPGYNGYTNAQLLTLPRVTTETGWVTQGTNAITEDQQGKLFLNLYLSAYKRGWTYTFVYMLHDDSNQGYWGFFHTDYSPKLSGTYLHNLTTILADTGSATPGALNYSIPSEPATVHDLLIQKSNGQFELAVWSEKATGTNSVTVNLGQTFATVKVYDPTVGTSPTQTLSNVSSVSLTLSDHPVILEPSGTGGGGGGDVIATTFVPTGSRQTLNGTKIGLTADLPNGNWVWGAGWNWGSPYVPATWDGAPQDIANLAEEKTALGVSLASGGSYTKPTQMHITADLSLDTTRANGGGLGFWSAMPARTDGADSLTGFTGLNLLSNGNLQLYANGAAVGSPVATGALTNGAFYTLAYDVNTSTGAISNVVFNGSAKTFSSTAFTSSATAFAGVLSRAGARASMKNFKVTPISAAPTNVIVTSFTTTANRQTLNGTQTGVTTDLPAGNWVWGAGWNWGSPYVPATWDGGALNCANLAEEKTALGLSLASSGSYTKPAHLHVSADLQVDTTRANGGGLGFWSAMPARTDGVDSLTGFTGLNLLANGNLQLYANGAAVGSPVATGALTSGVFYTLSYNVDTGTGAISSVVFNGVPQTFSSSAFTNAATAFGGLLTRSGARASMKNFTVTTW